ncbi:MAG: hypothetical protein GY757_11365, partial [bacterium]|nr:hypothetical protein [bacterium]
TAERFINHKLQATQATNYKQITKDKIQIINKKQETKKEKEPEKGYLPQQERTVPHNKSFWESRTLFAKRVLAPGGPPEALRLYKTGDLACWLPDGNIVFLGRLDQQVKVRGFRIELEEVERCLMTHPEMKEVVVIARESKSGDNFLCAYYIDSRGESCIRPSAFKDFLSRFLPQYMIPSFYIKLEKIPLTPSGKVDVKALPAPAIKGDSDYEAPSSLMEKALAEVWRQVLNLDDTHKLGVNDNFFNLGGDSIKTIQIASRMRKYDLKLEVKDLFTYQTIKQLTPHIKKISRSSHQGTVEGAVPLTPIQQWFFQASPTDSFHFNQSVLIYREEGFEQSILEKVFSGIVHHHDALRMVFKVKTKTGITDTATDSGTNALADCDTTIIQRNRGIEGELFHMETFDLKELDKKEISKRIPIESTRIQAGFDLEKGPLVRCGLFKTASGDHLLIAIHHLAVDGVSWRILLEDIQTCLKQAHQGEPLLLPEKTDS